MHYKLPFLQLIENINYTVILPFLQLIENINYTVIQVLKINHSE